MRGVFLCHIQAVLLAIVAGLAFVGCDVHSDGMRKKTSSAPALPPPVAHLRETLPNGMVLLMREDHSAPVVSAQVWARTGSIDEGTHLGAGLSHILEHMLFKGTEKRGVGKIAQEVEACGGSINAYTSLDRTVYHIDVPSDGGKPGTMHGTETAIDILADAIMHSTLPTEEYAKEQQVILREIAMRHDDPDDQATKLLLATAYQVHPCRYPVIGYEEVYRTLTREDALSYYRERYVPNNLIFVVAGDIDPARVRAQITQLMGEWPRRSLSPVCIPEEPPQVSGHSVAEESRTAAEQARLHVAYQTCDFRHPDSAPLEVMAVIAGRGMSSRLYQELREKGKLVHEVDAWSSTPAWRGLFGSSAIADPDKVDMARSAILSELEKFKDRPVSPGELSKALKMALSSHLASRKTMDGQASQLAGDELLCGDPTFSDRYLELLMKVTPADIQRVARKYFQPDRLTVVILQPKGDLKKAAASAEKSADRAIQKKTLDNGLVLLTKEDHRLPFVELRLVMKSGLLFETAKENGISQLTSRLLLKGTKNRSAEKIARDIESVGGSITAYSGANSMGICIEVMKPDLPLGLEILDDILRNATFEPAAIEREKMAQVADIRQEREQPVKIAMLNARARLFGRHPYSMPNLGTEPTVTALKRDDLVAFWKRVAVPSNMVLSVFGDIEPSAAQKLVSSDLGSLNGNRLTMPSESTTNFGKADRVVEKQDKKQGVVVIGYPGIDLKNPDRPAIELMNAALSSMGSRLFIRLRDQSALCYYVGVNEMIGLNPGFIYFYIGTEPAKLDRAESEILSEIEKLRKGGLTPEELERARNGLLGDRKMQKQNLGELAMVAALDELYGLGYDYADKLEAAYSAVTIPQVQSIAEKYLSQKSVVSVVKP
jgi:zinc protease